MSQPQAVVDDARIAAIVKHAKDTSAHALGLRTGAAIREFGWPVIDGLIRCVERHCRNHTGRPFYQYLTDIEALLALAGPLEFDDTMPPERRFRNLCGQLRFFGPADRKAYGLHFVSEIDLHDASLSVKYDGRHELVPFRSVRIMSAATLTALRRATPRFLRAYMESFRDDIPEYRTAMERMLEAREL